MPAIIHRCAGNRLFQDGNKVGPSSLAP